MTNQLTAVDFSRLTSRAEGICAQVMRDFPPPPLCYRALDATESERMAEEVERVMREGELRVSGHNDAAVWERGWGEVADHLKNQEITIDTLRPQYFRGEATCRLFGRYIRPASSSFEYDVGLVLRRLIFDEFLKGIETTVEFGCGTGINLLLLSQQFPEMRLVGTDWAPQSRDILSQMARQEQRSIEGHVFNMLTGEGWAGDTIDRGTAVMTVHAMEQLGPNWQRFADYLDAHRPRLVLHIEPILEFYDQQSLFDERARRYHLRRGYLNGYYSHLEKRAQVGQCEILCAKRTSFGGLFHEAYSVVAWRH
ncbi:MAG: hypothetical protein JWL84_5554 [Rhodospirillales bacterium]|nr:hypothetical protein [Rhodospirillales bacterium]